jgi:hypothetical protein
MELNAQKRKPGQRSVHEKGEHDKRKQKSVRHILYHNLEKWRRQIESQNHVHQPEVGIPLGRTGKKPSAGIQKVFGIGQSGLVQPHIQIE